jgi:hypothetical protein
MWWAVTNSACMGHHNWVNEEVNETRYRRWVERDTIDKTGTHQQWSPALTTHFAFELLFLETFLNGTDFGLVTAHSFSETSSHGKHMP